MYNFHISVMCIFIYFYNIYIFDVGASRIINISTYIYIPITSISIRDVSSLPRGVGTTAIEALFSSSSGPILRPLATLAPCSQFSVMISFSVMFSFTSGSPATEERWAMAANFFTTFSSSMNSLLCSRSSRGAVRASL